MTKEKIIDYIFINTPLLLLWYFFSASPLDFLLYYNIELILLIVVSAYLLIVPRDQRNSSSFSSIIKNPAGLPIAAGVSIFTLAVIFFLYTEQFGRLPILLLITYGVVISTAMLGGNKLSKHPIHQKIETSGDVLKWSFFLELALAFYPITGVINTVQYLIILLILRLFFTMMGTIKVNVEMKLQTEEDKEKYYLSHKTTLVISTIIITIFAIFALISFF